MVCPCPYLWESTETDITSRRNIQETDIISERNIQWTDFTSERNVQGQTLQTNPYPV